MDNLWIIYEYGWWLGLPLKNMKVNWDDYSQYMEKIKNVPNHQQEILRDFTRCSSIWSRAFNISKSLSFLWHRHFCLRTSQRLIANRNKERHILRSLRLIEWCDRSVQPFEGLRDVDLWFCSLERLSRQYLPDANTSTSVIHPLHLLSWNKVCESTVFTVCPQIKGVKIQVPKNG